jgi:hypothetical protein
MKVKGMVALCEAMLSCRSADLSRCCAAAVLCCHKEKDSDSDHISITCSGRRIPGSQAYCLHGVSGPSSSSLSFRVTSTSSTRTYNWTAVKLTVSAKCTFNGRGSGGSYVNVVRPNGSVVRTLGRGKLGTVAIGGEGHYLLAWDNKGRVTMYRDVNKLLENGGVTKDMAHWHSSGVVGLKGINGKTWCSIGRENVYVEWEVGVEKAVHFIPRVCAGGALRGWRSGHGRRGEGRGRESDGRTGER